MFIWTMGDLIVLAIVTLFVVAILFLYVWDKWDRWRLKKRFLDKGKRNL